MAEPIKQEVQQTQPPKPSETQPADTKTLPQVEKELFVWKAPSRSFRRRGHDYWVRLIAIASVFGLIFFVIEGVMPVILLVALIFLYYVLSTVEPENVEYRITNFGFYIEDKLYEWNIFTRFWLTRRFNQALLSLETISLPGRLELIINTQDQKKIREILTPYLPYDEPALTRLDKASNWMADKFESKPKN